MLLHVPVNNTRNVASDGGKSRLKGDSGRPALKLLFRIRDPRFTAYTARACISYPLRGGRVEGGRGGAGVGRGSN